VLRSFAEVIAAVEAYCPWVTRCGPVSAPCPPRPRPLLRGRGRPGRPRPGGRRAGHAGRGRGADGLFAAVLAARRGLIVPAGGTPAFLAPLPVAALGRDDLTALLDRLGIRTVGGFAALPTPRPRPVRGRRAHAHRVAGGRSGELAELRQPRIARLLAGDTVDDAPVVAEPGFWGGASDADTRAPGAWPPPRSCSGPTGW